MKQVVFIILGITLFSCQSGSEQKNVVVDKQKLRENIIKVNKPAVVMEQDEINAYIRAHGYAMQRTGTGLCYMFLRKNEKGKKVVSQSEITVNYKVWLLDGTLCYSSEKKGPKKFMVDADNVESGVHEGVKLMREGEKALFILPSHLAFGLIGDRDKIPPKAAVVYEIEVIRVK